MPIPRRIAACFTRLELATGAAILALAIASIFFWATLGMPTGKSGIRYICLASAGIDVIRYPSAEVPIGPVASISVAGSYSVLLWPNSAVPLGGAAISLPMWPLLILPLIPGLIRLTRRALMPKGRCRACGYDLSGLDAARPCPECGESRIHTKRLLLAAARV